MIASIFHIGSGLGNQLHRYVATRVLALDKGYEFSMVAPKNFKGKDFMNVDMGLTIGEHLPYRTERPSGKVICETMPLWEEKTNYYNPEFNFIENCTIVDGEFQDERYFGHRLKEIDNWLKVEPIEVPHDVCVIGFRGGEFVLYSELFLTKEYWAEAKVLMLQKHINMQFEVHTDDEVLARQFFPDCKIVHDMGTNWRSMRYAKYAIIANSSFYILPRLLQHHNNKDAFTISPRYWARRNAKVWSLPQNYYKNFTYI